MTAKIIHDRCVACPDHAICPKCETGLCDRLVATEFMMDKIYRTISHTMNSVLRTVMESDISMGDKMMTSSVVKTFTETVMYEMTSSDYDEYFTEAYPYPQNGEPSRWDDYFDTCSTCGKREGCHLLKSGGMCITKEDAFFYFTYAMDIINKVFHRFFEKDAHLLKETSYVFSHDRPVRRLSTIDILRTYSDAMICELKRCADEEYRKRFSSKMHLYDFVHRVGLRPI